ncbi:MAG: hypothetical protein AVDCRST_MAG67-4288, partial [uncultured Solirubrobacteraceae bacterium]
EADPGAHRRDASAHDRHRQGDPRGSCRLRTRGRRRGCARAQLRAAARRRGRGSVPHRPRGAAGDLSRAVRVPPPSATARDRVRRSQRQHLRAAGVAYAVGRAADRARGRDRGRRRPAAPVPVGPAHQRRAL